MCGRVLLLAEFSEAANDTCVGLIAAAYLIEPVDGIALFLLGTASRHAGVALIRVLSLDRPGAVRDCEGQHEEEQCGGKESENSSGHFCFLLTD
jgi:hypothetical protein